LASQQGRAQVLSYNYVWMLSGGHPNASHPVSKFVVTCFTVRSREQPFTITFCRLHIVWPMAWAVFSTQVGDIEFIKDTTVCAFKPLITHTLP